MQNKLRQYFFIFISSISCFILLYSIFGPQVKQIDLQNISFSTSESSEIYFKNLRSFFYELEDREDAGFKLYRIKTREKDSTKNKLNFVLVLNWRFDECYLICESTALKSNTEDSQLTLLSQYNNEYDTLSLTGFNNESYYAFAAQLYEILQKENSLFLLQNDQLFVFSEEELSSLKTSLKDYFKLVQKIR